MKLEYWETTSGHKATIVAKNVEDQNVWIGYIDTGNFLMPRMWDGKTHKCISFPSDDLKGRWVEIPWDQLPKQAKCIYQLRNGGWRWSSHIPNIRPWVREPNEITYDYDFFASNVWRGNIPDGLINWKGDYKKSLHVRAKD